MTSHLHPVFVPGCYRCDLNRDELPQCSCSCGDSTRPHINHRKTIPCWTYLGRTRHNIGWDGRVLTKGDSDVPQ